MLDAHALRMVTRPVYIPKPNLAVFPQEYLDDIPLRYRYVPAHRQEVVHEDYRSDINKLFEQHKRAPEVEKPPKFHWFGPPVPQEGDMV